MRRAPALILTCLLASASLAPSAALANSGTKEKAAAVTYVALQPLTASAVRNDGRKGVLVLETGIEAHDPVLMERVQASTPRLRAAFAQVLMIYASGLRRGAAPDIDYLGNEMQKAADKVLGRKGAKVLLGSAMMN